MKNILKQLDVCVHLQENARQLLSGLLPTLREEYSSSADALVRLNCRSAVNDQGRSEFEADVAMLTSLERLPPAVILSKIDSPYDVDFCMEYLKKVGPGLFGFSWFC